MHKCDKYWEITVFHCREIYDTYILVFFLALEGQQKTAFLEIYVLAMNISDQDFIGKFE